MAYRDYAPSLGRFLTRDPIGMEGDINLYAYTQNNPVNGIDPMGLDDDSPFWRLVDDCLDVSSFAPGGELADGIHALTFLARGQVGNAALYGASTVPILHEANEARKGAKMVVTGYRAARTAIVEAGAAEKVELEVATKPILFGQASVANTFAHGKFAGKTINEVSEGLRSGRISPDSLPVQFIERNAQRIAINNRSLTALRRAGMSPTSVIDVTNMAKAQATLEKHLMEVKPFPHSTVPSRYIRIRGSLPNASFIR